MSKSSKAMLSALTMVAVLFACAGCGPGANSGPAPAGPQGGMPTGPGDTGGPPSNIKQIMGRIGKPPQSLHNAIGEALKADQPAWEAIQPQAKDYVQLTAALTRMNAPKGSKESWDKETAAYAQSATALDAAIAAKDRDAAKTAHGKLNNACTSCHKEFRGRGPG